MKLGIIAERLKKTNFLSMVWKSSYHAESTIDLFEQQAPCHFVRERQRRERDRQIGSPPYSLRKPFLASNDKNQIASRFVAMSGKPGSKLLATEALSGGVQQNKIVGRANSSQQLLALGDCQSAFSGFSPQGMQLAQGQFAEMLQALPIVFDETHQMDITSPSNPQQRNLQSINP